MNEIDKKFVQDVESSDFRTDSDTGANLNALYVWNKVRKHVGLPPLTLGDLPAYCATHLKYHVILTDYGCIRKA